MDDLHPWMPALADDPYPWYAELRAHEPVHHSPAIDAWFVSRYDDAVRVLRSPAEFSSAQTLAPRGAIRGPVGGTAGAPGRRRGFLGAMPDPSRFLLTADPPDHTRLRRMVSRPFTPSAVAALEPFVRSVTEELVDGLLAASSRGDADLIAHLAHPLPLRVIAHLLGIDDEHDAGFREVAGALTLDAPDEGVTAIRPATMLELMGHLSATIAARRAEPRADLVSMLVTGDEPLDDHELLMFAVLLLVAGNETTTSLVGNATLALWANPGELRRLARDPSLVPAAVEEALRFDAPVQALARHTTRAADVGGTTIPADARVYVLYASANRDEDRFPDAGTFDITRKPRDHLAFGAGIHFCLGAALARLEARVAAEVLLTRVARVEPAGPIVRKPTPPHPGPALLRGVARLPVTVTAR